MYNRYYGKKKYHKIWRMKERRKIIERKLWYWRKKERKKERKKSVVNSVEKYITI